MGSLCMQLNVCCADLLRELLTQGISSHIHWLSYLFLFLHTFDTLRPRQNGRHFPDDIFKWIFVPRGPINKISALVQIMAWRRPGDKPLSEPMLVFVPTHLCVTWPQWVNTLGAKLSPFTIMPQHKEILPLGRLELFILYRKHHGCQWLVGLNTSVGTYCPSIKSNYVTDISLGSKLLPLTWQTDNRKTAFKNTINYKTISHTVKQVLRQKIKQNFDWQMMAHTLP